MDASKKQREPVAFKSLAELKRFIRPGVEFKTVSHANHADMVGLTRVVTTVQTVGFYSKIKDQPEHPFSTCNHGKGFYTDFGKAGKYIFDGTTVKVKDSRKQDRGVIYELEFYDREQNMEETMMDRKMVNFIREQYPPGTRIRLNAMDDPYAPILPGTEGEVDFVDDKGQIFMKWDNGRTLPLAPGEDSFTVLPPKLTTLKLYMPLTADLYERNEYGDFDDSSTLLEGSELRGYQDQIMAALVKNRMPEETERGLMHWYDEADSVNRKVHSAVFTVEKRDRQLWGVAECRVAGELLDTELETLKEYLTRQASDGWGEGFEQREISVDDGGELYVHLWNSDEWNIQTEQELFAPKLAEGLPELCFSTLPGTGELICIKRGVSGYYPSDWSTDNPAQNRELADYNNERLGVTQSQRLAMECGSIHGWSVPGADPSYYEQKIGGMKFGYLKIYPCLKERPDVLEVLKKSDRKMKYMEVDLKSEQRRKNAENGAESYVPSKEDSLERLVYSAKCQFADDAEGVEDAVIKKDDLCRLRAALDQLSEEERALIHALFFDECSERELEEMMGIHRMTIHNRKIRILQKMKKMLR